MNPPAARSPSGRAEPGEAAQLSALLGEVMSHVHRRSAGDTLVIMSQAGLTMAQLVSLHVLGHRGASSVSAIAAALRLSPAATSHLVDRLVQGGYVERSEDPRDRRAKRVAITATGRSLVERVQAERAREFADVLARLSPEVRRSFADVLGRVIAELAGLPERIEPRRASRLTKAQVLRGATKRKRRDRTSDGTEKP
jgi:DNA-binding MarR family transcriptional regulator